MSDINLDFTVNNNSINFTVEPNDITITPTDIQLNITTSAFGPTVVPGGSTTQLQYNNAGVFGGIPNVTYNGSKLSLGNVANVLMTGGTNGYVLQTDGTGNLSWTAQTGNGGGGNGTPGGANTQIQYNDSGSFGGNAGFTFNEVDGNVNMPANLIVAGNIYGNIANSGNANVANFANYAGNVTVSAQPNITSVGSLANLTVVGNINSGNIYTAGLSGNIFGANVITANTFVGNGSQLTGIISAAGNANYANYAGNATSSNTAGTVTTNAQPNITSVGTLTSLTLSSNNIALGNGATSANRSIAIGNGANVPATGFSYPGIAIGANSFAANTAISIGYFAGDFAGNTSANANYSIAIGQAAGYGNIRGVDSIAIGRTSGPDQGANSVAIGVLAGYKIGANSVTIGAYAGHDFPNSIPANTMILNATGANLGAPIGNALYVKPIRDVTGNASFTVQLYYNPTTGEIGYK